MTFSIVARCPDTGQIGVGAVTASPGVGKLLAWASAGVGAVATQSWVNPHLGIDGLALLSSGHPADRALRGVLALDEDRDLRQVAIVDGSGGTAAWTGAACEDVAGDLQGNGWSVQGNVLETGGTLDACATTFDATTGKPLVERLIAALEAGETAGGDRRGARSANLYIVDREHYPLWDVRVDDHVSPLEELVRLQQLFADELLPQLRELPTRTDLARELSRDARTGLL
jgi:uncharacterized Ntn-hydrolase superfamily protein